MTLPKVFISRPMIKSYAEGRFTRFYKPRPGVVGINDRRKRYGRLVMNPDHEDRRNVFLKTIIARHMAGRGLIQLTEEY